MTRRQGMPKTTADLLYVYCIVRRQAGSVANLDVSRPGRSNVSIFSRTMCAFNLTSFVSIHVTLAMLD